MLHQSAKLAKFLLEIKAIKLSPSDPFIWTSGIASPIYCDNRLVLSFPEVRDFVAEALADIILSEFNEVDRIAGIATAGIAHGVLCADRLKKSYCYVRPEPKKHGLKNQVEGLILEGDKVVLIEDLISTGKSSLQAIDGVRKEGGEVIGLVSLFNYGFEEAKNRFEAENIKVVSISNFDILCDVAASEGFITSDDIEKIKSFAKNPKEWNN